MPVTLNRIVDPYAAMVAVGCALASAPGHAAGPWLSGTGGADMGLAGAGRAALALDAASLSANPAALAALPGSTATLAVIPHELDYVFRGADEAPARATNQDGITAIPAAYAVLRDGPIAFGLGAYSYLGLTFDSGDGWGGQRAVEQAGVATFNLAPTVAWTVDDRVTLGASVAAQIAEPELSVAVANDADYYGPPAGLPDGRLRVSGDSWAVGGQLGVLYELRRNTRIGIAWTAPVNHSVPLDVEAQGLHPVLVTLLPPDGAANLDLELPQQILLGVSHEPRNGTLVSFGASWQDWSSVGESRLELAGNSAPVFPHGLRDTWGAAAGIRRALDEHWAVSTGVSYESSPAPAAGVPAYFPVAGQWKLAAGVERRLGEALRLRGSLSVILQGDAEVDQTGHPLPLPGIPQFNGTYEDTRVYVASLAVDFQR